jgi:hypothetical protein
MDNRLTLGVVHVVEWLGDSDAKTGRELFDDLEPLGIASKPEVVVVRFWNVRTRDEFLALFDGFETEFKETGRIPLLDIETHGSPDGIGASDQEYVLWPDLMERLIPLNHMTRPNLVVILGACKGFWGLQMLQPGRGASAFRGLIGPRVDLTAGHLRAACMAFYRTRFEKMDGDAALKAMNDAVDSANETFWTVSAEFAFKIVFRGYVEKHHTPDEIEARIARIEAKALAQRRADGLPDMFARTRSWGAKSCANS